MVLCDKFEQIKNDLFVNVRIRYIEKKKRYIDRDNTTTRVFSYFISEAESLGK